MKGVRSRKIPPHVVLLAQDGESPEERELRVAEWLTGHARARNTERSYWVAWRSWERWCEARGQDCRVASEAAVRGWLADLVIRGLSPSTATTYLAGLRRRLIEEGSSVRDTYARSVLDMLDGLRREIQRAPRQAAPLTAGLLRRCLEALPRTRGGLLTARSVRDRALLLVGYCGGLRRSEIAGLNWSDVVEVLEPPGLVLAIRNAKTAGGRIQYVGLGVGRDGQTCPVAALAELRMLAGGCGVCVFGGCTRRTRGARITNPVVSSIVRAAVARIGLDPRVYSGHSLRAGLVTDLAPQVEAAVGMRQSRHRSPEMWGRYYRPRGALAINFTAMAGL